MPGRSSFARVSTRKPSSCRWLAASVGTAGATALIAGGHAWWVFTQDADRVPYQAPAAAVLCLMGVWQLAIASRLWRNGAPPRLPVFVTAGVVAKWLFVGMVLAYAWALCLGPDDHARYLFQAVVAAWCAVGAAVAFTPPRTIEAWCQGARGGAARFGARAVVAAAFVAAVVEGGTRLVDMASDQSLSGVYMAQSLKLAPGEVRGGRPVNRMGYWDQEFEIMARPGRYRVAVVGDEVALSGTAHTNFLEQLERRVPGIEIYNFSLPSAGLRDYAAQLVHDVTAFRPDLVLAIISVGNDITHQVPPPSRFDWHGLKVYQGLVRTSVLSASMAQAAPVKAKGYESHLDLLADRLEVCRTPIQSDTEAHWREAATSLDRLVRRCRKREIPLALVLAPEEFQVSSVVCGAVSRRLGCLPGQIDVELPQRRLKAFANELRLPVLDLLPYFRAKTEALFTQDSAVWTDAGHAAAVEAIGGWLGKSFGAAIAATAQASN